MFIFVYTYISPSLLSAYAGGYIYIYRFIYLFINIIYTFRKHRKFRVRGGTPNGVMKLPGRVMAGGVVPAGG